ncbi:MAG: hypothetical protein ABIG84_00105 [archaeon]
MGFLDKVKEMLSGLGGDGKGKEEDDLPHEDVSLEYKEAKGWLDSVSKPFISDIDGHVSVILESMKEIKEQLEKDALGLKDAKIDEMRDKRMERAVINNRKALVSKLNTFMHGVNISKTGAFEAFGFFDSVKDQMAHFMMDTKKNFYFVDTGIPDVAESVKDDLFEMSKKIDEAFLYLGPLRDKVASVDASYKLLGELDADFLKKKELDRDILLNRKRLKEISKSCDALKGQIADLDKGADALGFLKLNEEHRVVLDEIDVVKARIVQSLSVISRGLKKYSRVAQLSGKEEERLLGLYIDDPVSAVEEDEGSRLLKSALSDLEMHVSRGSISLKDKLKEKTMCAISRLKKDDELDGLRKELMELKAKETEIRGRIESDRTMQGKKELECQYARVLADVESLKSDVSLRQKMLESVEVSIGDRIVELEGKLSGTGNYSVRITR